jgi:hypothetical protein
MQYSPQLHRSSVESQLKSVLFRRYVSAVQGNRHVDHCNRMLIYSIMINLFGCTDLAVYIILQHNIKIYENHHIYT